MIPEGGAAMRVTHIIALGVGIASTTAAMADDRVAVVPKTLDEGMVRLEKLLGRQSDKDLRQYQFDIKDGVRITPQPGKPIDQVTEGIVTYGVPVRSGGIITFDQIVNTNRKIYDIGQGGKQTLSRVVENHTVVRYILHLTSSGEWFYDGVYVSHNIPQFRDRPSETGRVNWLADGIELVGTGSDEFFRQGGGLAPGAFVQRRRLTLKGDQLIEDLRSKTYEFARSPDGDTLPIPDFSRPFGDEFKSVRQSVPLTRQ
jgi:hypothetical protein